MNAVEHRKGRETSAAGGVYEDVLFFVFPIVFDTLGVDCRQVLSTPSHGSMTASFAWGSRRLKPRRAFYGGQVGGSTIDLWRLMRSPSTSSSGGSESGAGGAPGSGSQGDMPVISEKVYDPDLSLYLALAECHGVNFSPSHHTEMAGSFRRYP